MNYAVVPLTNGKEDIRGAIERIDKSYYSDYAPDIYFVRFSGTARALSEKLGFGNDDEDDNDDEDEERSGIVLLIDGYFGYANADLWTWLNPKK